MAESPNTKALALIQKLATQIQVGCALGSMSPSIYDTAWLSMIRKSGVHGGPEEWLFPECFDYILLQQSPSGAWESYATPVDGILNTAAALLSLKGRLKVEPGHGEWVIRSKKAEESLKQLLSSWDIYSTDQVGFELLVITHLELLEQHDVCIKLPHIDILHEMRKAKLAKIPLPMIYRSPSTLHHSLEAFIGHIDFDRIRPLQDANGSMMGSPASTAAYLMNSSDWDDKAETYLRNVVTRNEHGYSQGGVPSAWPTPLFELSWIITAFASAGIDLDPMATDDLRTFIQTTFEAQGNLVGFAPNSLPDADDTAKTLEALHYMGYMGDVDNFINAYEGAEYFVTYPGERNPSFSANCNALILFLLRAEDGDASFSRIVKTLRFLTVSVREKRVHDKWHLSELYWMMLLSRAFELLVRRRKLLTELSNSEPKLRKDIDFVSEHILSQILLSQHADGSWQGICETTAYAVLALNSLSKLQWIHPLSISKVVGAMSAGKSYLMSRQLEWSKGAYLWIEKVTYSLSYVSEAYCIAASFVALPQRDRPAL
ncbi:hypothetical protein F5Y16DRAFT_395857 [Xylariaceae sp. FL0255]|nr:hypothetical protein F5Y16DRAFT_395857 [Xylariaceae sp. FL0255]